MPRHFHLAQAGFFLIIGAGATFGLFGHPTPMEFALRSATVGGGLIGLFAVAMAWRQSRNSARSPGKPG